MLIRKLGVRIIVKADEKYITIYWSWYAQENESELLLQLTKILEEDDEEIENS